MLDPKFLESNLDLSLFNLHFNTGKNNKKYYYPLDNNSTFSNKLFNNIICLPFNTDITFEIIDYYIEIITKKLLE